MNSENNKKLDDINETEINENVTQATKNELEKEQKDLEERYFSLLEEISGKKPNKLLDYGFKESWAVSMEPNLQLEIRKLKAENLKLKSLIHDLGLKIEEKILEEELDPEKIALLKKIPVVTPEEFGKMTKGSNLLDIFDFKYKSIDEFNEFVRPLGGNENHDLGRRLFIIAKARKKKE